jgi:hypothetical protein
VFSLKIRGIPWSERMKIILALKMSKSHLGLRRKISIVLLTNSVGSPQCIEDDELLYSSIHCELKMSSSYAASSVMEEKNVYCGV